MAVRIVQHYQSQMLKSATQFMLQAVEGRMRIEVRNNTYDEKNDVIVLNSVLISSWHFALDHWRNYFGPGSTQLYQVEQIRNSQDTVWLATFPPQMSWPSRACSRWFSLLVLVHHTLRLWPVQG
jgi:nitric oxide reductase large subunit